jgi:hypothetical protein
MKKLKLSLDALEVQSFTTAANARSRGTVHGEQECTCDTCTYPNCETCNATCPDTCGNSCAGTCYSCDTYCKTMEHYATCDYVSCAPSCETMNCWCIG